MDTPYVPFCVIPIPAEHELLLARYVPTARSTSSVIRRVLTSPRRYLPISRDGPMLEILPAW
jgi:hypothetical protein